MKCYILFLFSFLFLSTPTIGQTNATCFEIKHLDFFGISPDDTTRFPASELDGLLRLDFVKDQKGPARKTNFLIPLIVLQLKGYHPACVHHPDTATFKKLKQLYFKIRQADISVLNKKSVAEQLEYIRQDFYEQVQNDTLLPFMGYTLDDGPFYGQTPLNIPDYKKGKAYPADFGTLFITNDTGKVLVTVVNKQDKHLWTRIMTGNSDSYLPEINFSKENITRTSLGYKLRMYSGGEALTLYLTASGHFRYYFHSW